jgi:hypothetical protein
MYPSLSLPRTLSRRDQASEAKQREEAARREAQVPFNTTHPPIPRTKASSTLHHHHRRRRRRVTEHTFTLPDRSISRRCLGCERSGKRQADRITLPRLRLRCRFCVHRFV